MYGDLNQKSFSVAAKTKILKHVLGSKSDFNLLYSYIKLIIKIILIIDALLSWISQFYRYQILIYMPLIYYVYLLFKKYS